MNAETVIVLLIIGLAAGVLSGLVGVGGGILLVPALVFFMGYTQHQAQGSYLGVLTLPVVILAFLKYYSDCKKMGTPIDLKVIAFLASGFILGGFVGSSIALKLNQEVLKKVFALILFYTAFKMMGWDKIIINLFK